MINLDLDILVWITNTFHQTWIVYLFYCITLLGNGGFIWLLYALLMAIKKKQVKNALMIVLSLLITSLIIDVLIKNMVQRPRPFIVSNEIKSFIKPSSYSFPSGHSATSFACAWTISLLEPSKKRMVLGLASLIALSRLILGVHYPSDIICGSILGVLISTVIYRLLKEKKDD